MAKISRNEKLGQMLALLTASQKKKIAKALAKHGFTSDEYAKGWTLFKNAVGASFAFAEIQPNLAEQSLDLKALDEWENKWFPIISATLEANFPELYTRIFSNLTQTDGVWLIPSVELLLERLATLVDDDASQEDKDAHELLIKRGLTSDVVNEAKQLITKLKTLDEDEDDGDADAGDASDEDAAKAAKKDAEDAMWAYYKEWSAIARVAIKSKKQLKQLGFLKKAPKSTPKEQEPENKSE